MMIIAFRAIVGAQPWAAPNRDYQKNVVVCCTDEMSGRRLAASQSVEEGWDAWLVPGFVRVEVYATETVYDQECVILTDAM